MYSLGRMVVFDGKEFARKIEERLKQSGKLEGKKLVIFQCDGKTKESLYVGLKRKNGREVGGSSGSGVSI